MKKFLMTTPQQQNLRCKTYMPVDNADLEYGGTHFPAIPLIHAYVEEGDAIKVITVSYDTDSCHRNLPLLESEIAKSCAEKGATFELESIEVPFDDSISAILDVYQKLITRFEDDDELYADITYGSKPMPIVLIMALQYAYRLKSNVSIECVTYGQLAFDNADEPGRIYDVTALVQLDEIVRLLADRNASDPAAAIKLILGE